MMGYKRRIKRTSRNTHPLIKGISAIGFMYSPFIVMPAPIMSDFGIGASVGKPLRLIVTPTKELQVIDGTPSML